MPNQQNYISALQQAIWRTHGCESAHSGTVYVLEKLHGKTVWDGDVEVFDLVNHPKARRAYAWAHLDSERDHKTRYVAVLEIDPVKDAKTAVQASIADLEKGQS